MTSPKIQRAIVSVSDKTGLADFARRLVAKGVELYSTGGTHKHLAAENIPVRDIASYTSFPEMMEGRLKTLHPKVHGGILCRHDNPEDMHSMAEHGILTFELVVVNLYPFEATIAKANVSEAEAVENIDIGGPTMVRAASKNHAFTTIVTSPDQYDVVATEIESNGCTSLALRRKLAGAAFAHTGRYDSAIAAYFAKLLAEDDFPTSLFVGLRRQEVLRYGENPHQKAALYVKTPPGTGNVVAAEKLHGKELSYNNLLDLDSALGIARSFADPAACVIKHNNPCGAACAATAAEALRKAMAGDPQSAFGSVLGINRTVDAATAEVLCEPGLFVEAVIAPAFDALAVEVLTTRPKWKANVRLMRAGALGAPERWSVRPIDGGALVQETDLGDDQESEWKVVTKSLPTPAELVDLRFAWIMVRHVKSNAITVAKDNMLLGAGAGQMSRVDSVEIAIKKAGDRVKGAVLGSDAFFPFADSIDRIAAAGIRAIIQPGGSRADDEVVAACDKHGIAMLFTGRRHFKH